eukprot:TRINITY_DN6460_c1_g3_i1.p1 TRINITY_DN6460_c1_g3~~TRINITY_DN6460_c1_g3_i1.p1  ORF type:complete len:330 (+),score=71.47 TRINITY_DN6460_c1_g3_i1:309-1298(+)
MADIVTQKQRLEDAIANNDTDQILGILETLASTKVTVELLKSTKIGVVVGRLRKSKDEKIVSLSSKLVDDWKNDITNSSANGGNNGLKGSSDSLKVSNDSLGTSTDSIKKEIKEEKVKPEIKEESKDSEKGKKRKIEDDLPEKVSKPTITPKKISSPIPTPSVKSPSSNPRDQIKENLIQALGDSVEGDEVTPSRAADLIERELHSIYGDVNKDYKTKYRSISFNLKNPKSDHLRRAVLEGRLSASVLCTMSPQEMASPEDQKKRLEIEKYNLEAAMIGNNSSATTDMFQCGKCKQRKCTYYQMQTRSADEPMTTFVTCVNCNNRWKFC